VSAKGGATGDENLSPLRRAVRNFNRLLRGRGVAAVLELLTITLVARTLDPAGLGMVVLVQAYALIVRGLLNFNVYEVLVRFGVPLLEARDEQGFKQLLRLTVFVDLFSTAAAMVIAMLAAPLVGKILGWDEQLPLLAFIYSAVLITYGFGTAKGVLRIFDRYDALGVQLMVGPVLRLAAVVVVVLWLPTDVLTFVVALTIATGSGNVSLIVRGWIERVRQTGPISYAGFSFKGWEEQFPGLRAFIGIVYWQSNLDMMPKYISTLLAGTFLGPAAAGYLRLANETTKILSKPGGLLRQVLFPDMVRMWVRRSSDFAYLLGRALLVSGLFGLLLTLVSMFGGRVLFSKALGEAYGQAAPLLTLILLAATIDLVATVLRAAGYAIGHAGKILRLYVIGAVIYLLAFAGLTPLLGLIGPGVAAIIGAVVPSVGIGLLVSRSIRNENLGSGRSA